MILSNKKKGFTLIELLVVIAIIALLLSIIVPSLKKAKELATGVSCLENLRSLSTGFYCYQEENHGQLISARTWFGNPEETDAWVYPPTDYDDSGNILPGTFNHLIPQECTVEREVRGIQKGKMWPYIADEDVYHCPADKRVSRAGVGFRSYSMVITLDRNPYGGTGRKYLLSKYNEITTPSNKYILVESQRMVPNANTGKWEWHWNMGSWYFNMTEANFGEPPANWHAKGVNLAYADGHAEKYKWKSQEILKWLQAEQIPNDAPSSVKGTEDANYFYAHIPSAVR